MKEQFQQNKFHTIKDDLTVISLSAEIITSQYEKYMDSNAKLQIQTIKDSVRDIRKTLDSA